MRQLLDIIEEIFQVPEEKRDILSIILWWELRRWPYNFAAAIMVIISLVLAACLESLLGYSLTEKVLGPMRDPDNWGLNPMTGFGYAIIANICYTGGWLSELLVQAILRKKARCFGPIALGAGLFLSVFVFTLPVFELGTMWLLHVVGLIKQ